MTFAELPIGAVFSVVDYNAPMYMIGRIYERVPETTDDGEPVAVRVMDGRIIKQNIGLWYNAVDKDRSTARYPTVWINSGYGVTEMEHAPNSN